MAEQGRRVRIATGLVIGAVALTGEAAAVTIRVPEDHPTVPGAIDAAAPGDSVLVAPGHWTDTITRAVQLGGVIRLITCCGFLKGGLTVIGSGPDQTTIDAGGEGPGQFVDVFLLADQRTGEVVLEGMTIAGAGENASFVFATESDPLTIRDCRFIDTHPGDPSNVIRMDFCDLAMFDTEIVGNSSDVGISISYSNIEVERCLFAQNAGTPMRGGGADYVIVRDCQFVENRTMCSAGIEIGGLNSVVVEGSTFVRNASLGGGGCTTHSTVAIGHSPFVVVRFNTFAHDSTTSSGAGLAILACVEPVEVSNNTFYGCYGCHAERGAAVVVSATPSFGFDHNLVTGSTGGEAMWNFNSTQTSGSCNDFWDNEEGDFRDWVPTKTDFFEDPLLCDPEKLDFTLREDSPCAEGNTPGCGQVGAYGGGCGKVAIEPTSWARVKARYREPAAR